MKIQLVAVDFYSGVIFFCLIIDTVFYGNFFVAEHKLWDGHQFDLFGRTQWLIIWQKATLKLRRNQELVVFMLR